MTYVRVPSSRLREWGIGLLRNVGISENGAMDVMDVLVDTQLRGVDTHGIIHLCTYLRRTKSIITDSIKIIKETKNTCIVDGGHNIGQIVGRLSMRKAIDYAIKNGVGIVVAKNSNHFGAVGYYAKMAVSKNCIGFAATVGSARVAPWGGIDPIIGNNPSSIAMPGPKFPIVLDMAVTVAAGSKILVAKQEGHKLPEGWAMNKYGKPTTDPDEALEGLLMPIGGYKGVGISVMLDLICGALSSGGFSYDVVKAEEVDKPQHVSHFFMAIDITQFVNIEVYMGLVQKYIDRYKGVRLAENHKEVFMPGEIEWNFEIDRRKNGIPFTIEALNHANKTAIEFNYEKLI